MTIKQQFRSAIIRGTGEAHRLRLAHPKVDFVDLIIDACLTNYCLNSQDEPCRAEYLSELIERSSVAAIIKAAVLKGLAEEVTNDSNLSQLFELAKVFAQHGDRAAKAAIYKRFYKKGIAGCAHFGSSAILELDGLEEMIFIARTIGAHLERHPKAWEDDAIVTECQGNCPGIDVWRELEIVSKADKFVAAYLKAVQENRDDGRRYKEDRRPEAGKDIFEEIEGTRYFSGARLARRQLPQSTIEELAGKVLAAGSVKVKAKYLAVFNGSVKFPFDPAILIGIVKGDAGNSKQLKEPAFDALMNFSSNEIRQLGLELLNGSNGSPRYLNVFVNNYRDGDDATLTAIAEKARGKYRIEYLAHIYLKIFRQNKTAHCAGPLLALYSKMVCSECRKQVLELLLATNSLPGHIRDEMKYDCNPETRKLVTD
jgi:hypothetical protein